MIGCTAPFMGTTGGTPPATYWVSKGCPTPCVATMTNMARVCNGNATKISAFFTAPGMTSSTCGFNCGGQTCVIRGADGLPVELLEFSVDEETPDGGESDEEEDGQTES